MTSYRSTSAFKLGGYYYESGNSRRNKAEFSFLIRSEDAEIYYCGTSRAFRRGSFTIVPGVGRAARTVEFADGSLFETDDVDSFSKLEGISTKNIKWNLVRKLESKLVYVLVSVLLLGGLVFSAYTFALPALASFIANRIPMSLCLKAQQQSIDMLDENFVTKSSLPEKKILRITKMTESMKYLAPGYGVEVFFRNGNNIGPNAFALPGGGILVTDQLVEISSAEDLEAVFAHELGHLHYRHSMQLLVHNSIITAAIAYFVGDIGSLASVMSSLPAMIVENGYSRKAEREADAFAAQYLVAKYGSAENLSDVLLRLDNMMKGQEIPWWLSTHPDTEERVKLLSKYARRKNN